MTEAILIEEETRLCPMCGILELSPRGRMCDVCKHDMDKRISEEESDDQFNNDGIDPDDCPSCIHCGTEKKLFDNGIKRFRYCPNCKA